MDTFDEKNKHPNRPDPSGIRYGRVDMGGCSYLFFRLSGSGLHYPADALSLLPKGEFAAFVLPSEKADFSIRKIAGDPSPSEIRRAFSAFVFEGLGYPSGTYEAEMGTSAFSVTPSDAKSDTGRGIYYEKSDERLVFLGEDRQNTEGGELCFSDYGNAAYYRLTEAEVPGSVDFRLLSGSLFSKKAKTPPEGYPLGAVACSLCRGADGSFPFSFFPRFADAGVPFRLGAAETVYCHLLRRGVCRRSETVSLRCGQFCCFCRPGFSGRTEIGLSPDWVVCGGGSVSVFFAKSGGISPPTS